MWVAVGSTNHGLTYVIAASRNRPRLHEFIETLVDINALGNGVLRYRWTPRVADGIEAIEVTLNKITISRTDVLEAD